MKANRSQKRQQSFVRYSHLDFVFSFQFWQANKIRFCFQSSGQCHMSLNVSSDTRLYTHQTMFQNTPPFPQWRLTSLGHHACMRNTTGVVYITQLHKHEI